MYPSLVLAYLGQGARLAVDGSDVLPNVFYLTIPGRHNGPLFWVQYVFAILATLIASQAMITATFSLVQQLLSMKCLPSYDPFSCVGFGLTHACFLGYTWCIRRTKFRVKYIFLLQTGFVSLAPFKIDNSEVSIQL